MNDAHSILAELMACESRAKVLYLKLAKCLSEAQDSQAPNETENATAFADFLSMQELENGRTGDLARCARKDPEFRLLASYPEQIRHVRSHPDLYGEKGLNALVLAKVEHQKLLKQTVFKETEQV